MASSYFYMNLIINIKNYNEGYGTLALSSIFAVDIIVNFLIEKEVENPEQIIIERNLKKIAIIYFNEGFFFDLITILPLHELFKPITIHSKFLLLIKALRFKKGVKALSANSFIETMREYTKERVE
jgi:hypothetical protein